MYLSICWVACLDRSKSVRQQNISSVCAINFLSCHVTYMYVVVERCSKMTSFFTRNEIISLGWWIRHFPLSEPDIYPLLLQEGNLGFFFSFYKGMNEKPRLLILPDPAASLYYLFNVSRSIPSWSVSRDVPICAL